MVIILSLGILVPQLIAWTSLGLPGPVLWLVAGLIALVGVASYLLLQSGRTYVFRQFERNDNIYTTLRFTF